MGKWDGNQRNGGLKESTDVRETAKQDNQEGSLPQAESRVCVVPFLRGVDLFSWANPYPVVKRAPHNLNPMGEWTPDYSEPDGEDVRGGGYCKAAGLDERKSVAGAIPGKSKAAIRGMNEV